MVARRRGFRVGAGAVCALAFVVLGATAASAHTDFASSEPADGAVVSAAPRLVRLEFSEKLSKQFVKVELFDAAGAELALAQDAVVVADRGLTVTLPLLAKDTYRVAYEVRDPVDVHLTTGAVVFGVGQLPTIVSEQSTTKRASPPEVLARLIERLALAALLGGLLVRFLLPVPDELRPRVHRRARRIIAAALVALGVAECTVLLIDAADIGNVSFGVLRRLAINSPFGRRSLVAVLLVIGIALMLRYTRGVPKRSVRDIVTDPILSGLTLLTAGLLATLAYSGHNGVGGSPWVGLAVRFVHLGAVGVWNGGLAVVLIVGASGSRLILLRSFSRCAAWAALATVASGLLLAGREVRSLTALFSTGFGQTLIVKISVLALVLLAASFHARRLSPGHHVPTRTLRLESVLLCVAVAAGVVMSVSAPAVGKRFEPTPEQISTRSTPIDDLLLTLSIRPNHSGRNTVTLRMVSTRKPEPGPIMSALVRLGAATAAPIELRTTSGTGSEINLGAVDLAAPGALAVTITVDRPALPVAPIDLDWMVSPIPVPRAQTIISDASLSGPLALAATAASLLGVGTLSVARRTRRHKPNHNHADDPTTQTKQALRQ